MPFQNYLRSRDYGLIFQWNFWVIYVNPNWGKVAESNLYDQGLRKLVNQNWPLSSNFASTPFSISGAKMYVLLYTDVITGSCGGSVKSSHLVTRLCPPQRHCFCSLISGETTVKSDEGRCPIRWDCNWNLGLPEACTTSKRHVYPPYNRWTNLLKAWRGERHCPDGVTADYKPDMCHLGQSPLRLEHGHKLMLHKSFSTTTSPPNTLITWSTPESQDTPH